MILAALIRAQRLAPQHFARPIDVVATCDRCGDGYTDGQLARLGVAGSYERGGSVVVALRWCRCGGVVS